MSVQSNNNFNSNALIFHSFSTVSTLTNKSLIEPVIMVVRSGFCTKECGISMWFFLLIFFFSVVASFASGIPSQQVFFFYYFYLKNI